ncbi:MAG TPA: hypothetical protein VKL21_02800 [Candidatus Methanoperedens sp.]|nr:hypothetical protein [Candidatus Methanoperedens sp.]
MAGIAIKTFVIVFFLVLMNFTIVTGKSEIICPGYLKTPEKSNFSYLFFTAKMVPMGKHIFSLT